MLCEIFICADDHPTVGALVLIRVRAILCALVGFLIFHSCLLTDETAEQIRFRNEDEHVNYSQHLLRQIDNDEEDKGHGNRRKKELMEYAQAHAHSFLA